VPGDLLALGQGAQLIEREAEGAVDQPLHLEPPVHEAGGDVGAVIVAVDVSVAVAAEDRRDVGEVVFARHVVRAAH